MDSISSASTSDEAEEQMNILNQLGEQANDNASAEKPRYVNYWIIFIIRVSICL
jgi:hypothetical protein